LGAQRREISQNDLPEALRVLECFQRGKTVDHPLALAVSKAKIAASGDFNLTGERYRESKVHHSAFPMVKLGEYIETIVPPVKIKKENFKLSGKYPVIDQSQNYIAARTNEENNLIYPEKPVVIFGDHTCAVKYIEEPFAQGADGIKILKSKDELLPKFLYFILQNKPIESDGYKRHFSKLKEFEIPLPPLEIQNAIVAEIEQWQKVIDGAKQVIAHYRPTISIDPNWEMVILPEISENCDNKRKPVTKSDRLIGEYPYYGASGIVDYVEDYIFDGDYLLISEDGANLLARNTPIAFSISGKTWVNNHAHILKFKNKATQIFVETYINQIDISNFITGMAQPKLNQQALNTIEIPLPSLEEQNAIVAELEKERAAVDACKQLITQFEAKIKAKIATIWGENTSE